MKWGDMAEEIPTSTDSTDQESMAPSWRGPTGDTQACD